jgi:hypothetical protein
VNIEHPESRRQNPEFRISNQQAGISHSSYKSESGISRQVSATAAESLLFIAENCSSVVIPLEKGIQ